MTMSKTPLRAFCSLCYPHCKAESSCALQSFEFEHKNSAPRIQNLELNGSTFSPECGERTSDLLHVMSSKPNTTTDPPPPVAENGASAKVVTPIIYDLPPHETASQRMNDLLRVTKDKFAARATRFGEGANKTPSDVHVLGARRAHVRDGFVTGFDTSTDAEKQKRENRKKRFETDPEIDDPEKRKSRAHRFGINPAAVKEGDTRDPLERRRDVAIGEFMRPNVIHLFGVDEMSTNDVMHHFAEFGPSWCEWLNDSSCNVAFEDEHTMKRVLNDATFNPSEGAASETPEAPLDKMGDGEGDGMSMSVAGEGSLPEEARWRLARPFMKKDVRIPLWVRQATENDVRPEAPNPKSHWSRTMRRMRHQKRVDRRRDNIKMRPRSRRAQTGSHGQTGESQQSSGYANQDITLGVRRDKAASIMKARMKKVSREDLFKALTS